MKTQVDTTQRKKQKQTINNIKHPDFVMSSNMQATYLASKGLSKFGLSCEAFNASMLNQQVICSYSHQDVSKSTSCVPIHNQMCLTELWMNLNWELEPNRKLFPDHLSSILHGALVGAGSLWPTCCKISRDTCFFWVPVARIEYLHGVGFERTQQGVLQFKPYGINVPEIWAFASKQATEKLSYEGREY